MRNKTQNRTSIIRVLALVVLACVAALTAIWLSTKPAEAAFPGNNGRIVFTSARDGEREIYTMKSDGTDVEKLTDNSVPDYDPAFSADGKRIAFTSRRDGNTDIRIMKANGDDQERLTFSGAIEQTPVFSPDGNKIAFVKGNGNDVYIMKDDGTEEQNLTNRVGTDDDPAFSPDGTRIAFYSTRDGNQEIYDMRASDGEDQRRLTDTWDAHDTEPNYSPDGSKITFTSVERGHDKRPEIYVMDANGDNPSNRTNHSSDDEHPAFSPDGNKIVFSSSGPFGNEIYTMNADGDSNWTLLTNNEVHDGSPDWQPRIFTVVPPTIPILDLEDPTITNLRPALGSRMRDRTPTIRATAKDNVTDLKKSNIKLYVDGRRKGTFRYDRARNKLTYTTGRLAYKRHSVRIVTKDAAGNVARKSWRFKVVR